MEIVDNWLREHGTFIGRVLIGILFLWSAAGILLGGVAQSAGMLAAVGVPFPILAMWLALAIKIAAGAALVLGYQTRLAALWLIIFTLAATTLFHLNSEDINLFKNLAIVGGLLYVYVYGPGAGWHLKVGKSHHSGPTMAI